MNMFKKPLATALTAAALSTGLATPASAEISGSLDIASQYLWRGQQLFSGGTISGSLDYTHASGLYTGIWTSSEAGRIEYDMYVGYGGEAGGVSYDISYIDYNYPDNAGNDADFKEIHLGAGMAGFAIDAYLGVDEYGHGNGNGVSNKDDYYSLSYTYDKFTILGGFYDMDAPRSNYKHVDVSYALTDNFTFTASKVVSIDDCAMQSANNANNNPATITTGPTGKALCNIPFGARNSSRGDADDVQFVVSYSFDL